MASVSIAIVAVFVLLLLVSVKAKYETLFVLLLPFFAVPLCYLVAAGVSTVFLFRIPLDLFVKSMVVFGGVVGGVSSFLLSRQLQDDKEKTTYAFLGIVYSIGLALAYLVNLI